MIAGRNSSGQEMAAAEETQISQTKLQLPKNYEAILEEADSQIDKSSSDKLCEQLYSGLFLNQKKKVTLTLQTREFNMR